jgi:hypothetical protein
MLNRAIGQLIGQNNAALKHSLLYIVVASYATEFKIGASVVQSLAQRV